MDNLNNETIKEDDFELLALGALLDLDSEVNSSASSKTSNKQETDNSVFLEDKFNEYNVEKSPQKFRIYGAQFKGNYDFNRKSPAFTDPVFGLRIINPQISSTLLTERMSNRKSVLFDDLCKLTKSEDMPNDWVIAGVILVSETKKKSKNGKPFTIWKLSDMRGDIRTVSLLLFHNAHNELWKTRVGTCVAVLNPCFMENKNGGDVASLSINSAQKVLLLGTSKDMGVCKAKKKNGEPCKNFVNINQCDFCSYHVQREYKKLTRPVTAQGLNCHNFKMAFDNAKLSTSYNTNKILQRNKTIMDTLKISTAKVPTTSCAKSPVFPYVLNHVSRLGAASNCEAETKQRMNDLERLKNLRLNVDTNTISASKTCLKACDIERSTPQKLKAIEILRKQPIEKVDPNSTRGTKEGKKRALVKLNIVSSPKRQKTEEVLKLKDIVETASAHEDLIDFRQKEEEEKYFSKLEKKEAMEEKMLHTFQLPCKAVICKICKYAAFSAAERCKIERHAIKIIDAIKRFFQCKDCGNRTTTLFKLPKLSCGNCASSRWERCGMVRDRTNIGYFKELSVRGDEEKFLGGTSSVNVDLLFPLE